MPKTKPKKIVLYTMDTEGKHYLDTFPTVDEALSAWKDVDAAIQFDKDRIICVFDPNKATAYIRRETEKDARRILKAEGRELKAVVVLDPPEAAAEVPEGEAGGESEQNPPGNEQEPPSGEPEASETGQEDAGAEQPPNTRLLSRDLTIELTPPEKAKMADRLANLQKDKEDLEADKASTVKEFNKDIQSVEAQISELAKQVRVGRLQLIVACRETFDYQAGEVVITRADTGDEVERRPMTDRERQGKLPLEGSAEETDKAASEPGDGPQEPSQDRIMEAISVWHEEQGLGEDWSKAPSPLALIEHLGGHEPSQEEVDQAWGALLAQRRKEELIDAVLEAKEKGKIGDQLVSRVKKRVKGATEEEIDQAWEELQVRMAEESRQTGAQNGPEQEAA